MSDQTKSYDFIVCGAGSAGCVLANRLSADPNNRVLLIEAGPRDWNPVFRVPIMAGRLFMGRYCNWGYSTEPEPHLDGRRIPWPRGKVVGGTSSINGMVYIRGHAADFDQWAQMGLPSWSYERVLPYFKRSEGHYRGGDDFHGAGGPQRVGPPKSKNPIFEAFVQAGIEAGHPFNPDFNGADQQGVGRYDYTIWRGQRWSAARGYLDPARARPNLTIMTGARLLKVLLRKGQARGVRVKVGKDVLEIAAEREVALCLGAIGSPQALMLSGVGDPYALWDLGLKCEVEAPDVGKNLRDHLQVRVTHESLRPDETWDLLRADRAAFEFTRTALIGGGPFGRFPHEGGAFLKSQAHVGLPDLQIHFVAGGGGRVRLPFGRGSSPPGAPRGYSFTGSVCHLRPESSGEVALVSKDPLKAPAIRANYLASDADRRALREGVRRVREIFAQKAFDSFRGPELFPGPDVSSDAELDRFAAATATTVFHPVGTCRMGADETAVVDEKLRVRGARRLRVVDASIMPRIVGGNTHAATLMIAERAAQMMLEA